METLPITAVVAGNMNSTMTFPSWSGNFSSGQARLQDSDNEISEKVAAERAFVERAINGDKQAFVALYDQHVGQVYKHVFYRVYSQVEAEDITQETFVKAWKAIDKYKITGAPFVAWLYTIAHNLIMDHYKAKKKAVSIQQAAQEEFGTRTGPSPEDIITEEFDKNRIKEAIQTLKGDKQKVILMRFIDGCSYKEIADALHKTEGAIRVIQFRALSDLKQIMSHFR